MSDTLNQSAELLPEVQQREIKQQLETVETQLNLTTKEILTDEGNTEAKGS